MFLWFVLHVFYVLLVCARERKTEGRGGGRERERVELRTFICGSGVQYNKSVENELNVLDRVETINYDLPPSPLRLVLPCPSSLLSLPLFSLSPSSALSFLPPPPPPPISPPLPCPALPSLLPPPPPFFWRG